MGHGNGMRRPDWKCPACERWHHIDEPMAEDTTEEHECQGCGKLLEISVHYSREYSAACVDAEHQWRDWTAEDGMELCKLCGELRLKPESKA